MSNTVELDVKRFVENFKELGPWDTLAEMSHELELSCFDKYGEGQGEYSDISPKLGILSGNWNRITEEQYQELEEFFELEWCDEWSSCSECCCALRTEPDHMSWAPAHWYGGEGGRMCLECLPDTETLLTEAEFGTLSDTVLRHITGYGSEEEKELPEGFSLIPLPDHLEYKCHQYIEATLREMGYDHIHLIDANYGPNKRAIVFGVPFADRDEGRILGPITTQNSTLARADILIAHYLFYRDHYDGMSDHFYTRMCEIKKLDPYVRDWTIEMLMEEEPIMREIYLRLCEKHNETIPEEIRYV